MTRYCWSACLLFAVSASGADIVIDAPTEVEPGSLIVATVTDPEGAAVSWQPIRPSTLQYRVYGTDFVCASGCTATDIEVMCTVVEIDFDARTYFIEQRLLVIKVSGDAPTPDPPDPPNPPDPPDVPDGLWELTKTAYDQAIKLPASQQRAIGEVSSNYQSVAARIVAGAIRTADAAKAAIKAANRADIPEADRALWGAWNQAIVAVLVAHDAELLANMTKIAEAYAAIADGLELAKE